MKRKSDSDINISYFEATEIKEDYLTLKNATRFLGQIQIILSVLMITSSIITITVYFVKVANCEECQQPLRHQYSIGIISFTSAILFASIFDIISACFLICGSNTENVPKCRYWCLSAEVSLILLTIVTITFIIVLNAWLLLLALLPSFILKPIGIRIVREFISKVWDMQTNSNKFMDRLSESNSSNSSLVATLYSSSSSSINSDQSSLKPLTSNLRKTKTTVHVLVNSDRAVKHVSFQKVPDSK